MAAGATPPLVFCTRCGAPQPYGAQFCPGCGNSAPGPTQGPTSVPPPYAGFWVRFGAYFLDSLIASTPFVLFAIGAAIAVPGLARGRGEPPVALFVGMLFFYFLIGAVVWLYYTLFESSARQATPGKMAFGLRVTDLSGNRISFGRANGRFFGKILSGMTFYIGFLMVGFTEKKQALHDMLAGTLVVKS